MRRSSRSASDRGFTLIETILVVVLIGLLVSLTLPALAGVRESARDEASIANMRSHAQILGAYAGEWDDYYPAFADPRATFSVVRGCGRTRVFRYFETVNAWPIALCDGYYDGVVGHQSFTHPGVDPDDPETPFTDISYFLSSAFLASPAFWEETTRTGPEQWGPSRLSTVAFPSQKAVLTEIHPTRRFPGFWVKEGIGLAFSDGGAGRFRADDLVQPYRRGEGSWWGTWLPVGIFGMHTVDGWAGRDRR